MLLTPLATLPSIAFSVYCNVLCCPVLCCGDPVYCKMHIAFQQESKNNEKFSKF